MKVNWDYSGLAKSYVNRPEYSARGLDAMVAMVGIRREDEVCDAGAGTAHLSIPLLERGLKVTAVEPNDNMRKIGQERTNRWKNIIWVEGKGEETGQKESQFEMVTFGSSFNVVDRTLALKETVRILKPGGWFVCMWNHRDLEDTFQAQVEDIIKREITDYDYGTRREDQSRIIKESGLFEVPFKIEAPIKHLVSAKDWVDAWRSHATLARQAGDKHGEIVNKIEAFIEDCGLTEIQVPYITRIWLTQKLV